MGVRSVATLGYLTDTGGGTVTSVATWGYWFLPAQAPAPFRAGAITARLARAEMIEAIAPFRAGAVTASLARAEDVGALVRRARSVTVAYIEADLDD